MASRLFCFIQSLFFIPTLLPVPTFACLPSRHHLRLPSFKLSKTTAAVTLIIINKTFEKMCSIGAVSILPNFLIKAFHLSQKEANDITFLFGGFANLVPIFGQQHPWQLCSREEVEHAKSVVKVLAIWTTSIIYQMVASELQTRAFFQALAMDMKIGPKIRIPAPSVGIFSVVALTTWVTLYDKVIIPLARKRRSNVLAKLSTLRRMGIGMSMLTLAAVVAGIVEGQRRRMEELSVFWLVPQLVLMGLAEGFNNLAQIEFYHIELPARLASLTGAFFAMGYSFGNFTAFLLDHIIEWTTKSSANPSSWIPDKMKGPDLNL